MVIVFVVALIWTVTFAVMAYVLMWRDRQRQRRRVDELARSLFYADDIARLRDKP